MRLGLALAAVLLIAALPGVHAQPPPGTGSISLVLGALGGTVKENGKDVVAYTGNATVSATVTMDCSLILYEFANKMGSDIDHFHVQPSDDVPLPPWLIADEFLTYFPKPVDQAPAIPVQVCATGAGSYTQTVDYPFAVSAAAPGGMPLNITLVANLGDDAISDPKVADFQVQFHPSFTLTPSLKSPYAVTGSGPVNFTLAVRNDSNGMAMVMFDLPKATAGSVKGFADVTLDPNTTGTLNLTFTPPTTCWTTSVITTSATIMAMPNGMPGNATPLSISFTHACGNTPGSSGNSTSAAKKKSPAPGFLMVVALFAMVAASRRRKA